MHAVACLITYAVCSYPRPFVHYCACFFLLFELSTPFMHLRTPRQTFLLFLLLKSAKVRGHLRVS